MLLRTRLRPRTRRGGQGGLCVGLGPRAPERGPRGERARPAAGPPVPEKPPQPRDEPLDRAPLSVVINGGRRLFPKPLFSFSVYPLF